MDSPRAAAHDRQLQVESGDVEWPITMYEDALMRKSIVGLLAVYLVLCNAVGAMQSRDAIDKAVAAAKAMQLDIAMNQKRFSIMSRGLAETERCVARELLDTSINFREVTDGVITIAQVLGEMKSLDDEYSIRRHLGIAAHRAVAIGENDIQLVDELMMNLATPEAIVAATGLRNKMIEVRDLLKPFASQG